MAAAELGLLMTNRTMSTLVTGRHDRRPELAMRRRYGQESIKLVQISLTACCVNAFADASLQNVAHTQFAGYALHVNRLVFIDK